MVDNDRQVSENLKQVGHIRNQHHKLARALRQLNQMIDKTYGVSVKLAPKKGIYCIEAGWLKRLEDPPAALDQIKSVNLIEKPEPKVEVIYTTGDKVIFA